MKTNLIVIKILLLYIFVIYISYENYKTNLILLNQEYVAFIKEKYILEVYTIIYDKIQDPTYIKENHLIKVIINDVEKYFITAFYENVVKNQIYLKTFLESFDWSLCVNYSNNIENISEIIFEYYLENISVKEYIDNTDSDLKDNIELIKEIIIQQLFEYTKQNLNITINYFVLKLFIIEFVHNITWSSYILTADFVIYDMFLLKTILVEQANIACDFYSLLLRDVATLITILSFGLILYYTIIPKIVLATLLKNKSYFIIEHVLKYFNEDQNYTKQDFKDLCEKCLILYNERYTDLQRVTLGPEIFIDYVESMQQPILNQVFLLTSINENIYYNNSNIILGVLLLFIFIRNYKNKIQKKMTYIINKYISMVYS